MRARVQNLSRKIKRTVSFSADLLLVGLTFLLSYVLRLGNFDFLFTFWQPWLLAMFVVPACGSVLFFLGIHRYKISTFESQGVIRTGIAAVCFVGISGALAFVTDLYMPRSIPFIFGAVFLASSVMMRLIAQQALANHRTDASRQRVIIYGGGAAGIQLAGALDQMPNVRPVGFVDDNPTLNGTVIRGLPVWGAEKLESLIKRKNVDVVALAIPSLSTSENRRLLKSLTALPVKVQTLPSFDELLEGYDPIKRLRPISISDVLGRTMVDLKAPEIANTYKNKSVLVSGGGGSIGSELCVQLLGCEISKLVVLEHSEIALYRLEQALAERAEAAGVSVKFKLGSVTDSLLVRKTIEDEEVQIVLHAAAYKHVPIVEDNELAGLQNNVLGTQIVAQAASDLAVERFILISTDKAVRPTNIMGASKRLAEIVVQDLASRSKETVFSMVRFGNVLGSSGSVIPLFENQIQQGGPVTVTHPEVTRFFMTIAEASRLVLLAGSYSKGGEVFVLDMGQPIKISQLARDMIGLAGLTVQSEDDPDGDIAIKYVGMRPGEKLYEELLIGDNMLPTPHSKIMRAAEAGLSELETAKMLSEIKSAVASRSPKTLRERMKSWVHGYQPSDIKVVSTGS